MLKREAQWIRDRLAEQPDNAIFPMCNIGGGEAARQRREQPWIEEYVVGPLRRRGERPLNVELRPGPGIDIAGDLTNSNFIAELAQHGFASVLCSNVLEHVTDLAALTSGLESILSPGGLALVTVPSRFPYHPDPIDTMFRPTPSELSSYFPRMDVVASAAVSGGTLATYLAARLRREPNAFLGTIAAKRRDRTDEIGDHTVAGPSTHGGIALLRSHAPWLLRPLTTSCVVLRKREDGER